MLSSRFFLLFHFFFDTIPSLSFLFHPFFFFLGSSNSDRESERLTEGKGDRLRTVIEILREGSEMKSERLRGRDSLEKRDAEVEWSPDVRCRQSCRSNSGEPVDQR